MKNRLLAAMALCCATSMSAWAGSWEKPQLQFVDPDLTIPSDEVPTTGYKYLRGLGDYYIYHVNTGKFLTDGNQYGTQLSIGESGQLVRLGYGYDRFLYNADSYNYLGWLLTMPNAKANAASDGVTYHEIYIQDSGLRAYVDGTKGHMLWKIMKLANGHYQIGVIDEDDTFGASSVYGGVWGRSLTADAPDPTTIHPLADAANSTAEETFEEGEFQFVAVETYEAYHAKLDMYDMLNQAEEQGVSETDLSESLAIYNSSTATAEEIQTATAEIQDIITESLVKNATAENPADLTFLIQNADCGSLDGWTTSGTVNTQTNGQTWTGGSDIYIEPCDWSATGWTAEFYQTISVPNGMYKLTASGRASSDVTLQLYANDVMSKFNSIGGEGGNIDVTGKEWASIDEGIANGATFANNNAGNGWEYRSVTVTVSDGQLKVGAIGTTELQKQWASIFKFTLLCLGPVNTDYMRGELNTLISEVEENVANYVSMNYYYSNAGKEAIDAALAEAKELAGNADATEAELIAMHSTLTESMEAFDHDVEVYGQIPAKLQELDDMILDRGAESLAMAAFWEYYDSIDEAYNDRTFDPAEFDNITANAEAYFVEGVREALVAGETTDATALIVNPKFANGGTGWSGTSFQASNNGVCVEQYNKEFDNYQELTGLPAGTYEITVQAFYRPGGYAACASNYLASGDTSNDIRVYLYGNSAQTPVKHLFEECYDEDPGDGFVALSAPNAPDVDGKYVPNTYTTAATAFNDGKYAGISVRCAVGEDGVLRLGMKTVGRDGTVNNTDWSAFTNFTLTYLPGDLSGNKAQLETVLAEAETLYQSDAVKATKDAADLNALRTSIVMAMGDYTTAQQYIDAQAQLEEAIDLVQKGVDLISEIYTQALGYQEVHTQGGFDSYDPDLLYHLIYDLCDEITYSYDDRKFETYTNVEALAEDLNNTYATMVQGGSGSVENPLDVTGLIKNPSFSDAAGTGTTAGWEIGEGALKTSGESNDNDKGDNLVEVFSKSGFDVNQTITYALTPGWYILKMQGFYRNGSIGDASNARYEGNDKVNAYLYVIPSDQTGGSLAICSIFDGIVTSATSDAYHTSDRAIAEVLLLPGETAPSYVPDRVAGANARFAQDYYWNEIAFEVTDATESVRFGVKMAAEDAVTNDWTAMDNFKLLYTGTEKPDVPTTGIGSVEVSTADVVSSVYYTIGGVRIEKPAQSGLYIREDLLSDGTRKVTKIMVK